MYVGENAVFPQQLRGAKANFDGCFAYGTMSQWLRCWIPIQESWTQNVCVAPR